MQYQITMYILTKFIYCLFQQSYTIPYITIALIHIHKSKNVFQTHYTVSDFLPINICIVNCNIYNIKFNINIITIL